MRDVVILGATGSVGASALAVLREFPGDFRVVGVAARRSSPELARIAAEFPDAAVAASEDRELFEEELRRAGWRGRYFHGADAAVTLVRSVAAHDCVAAIGGTAGLRPAFAAAAMGLRILLANKEVLVSAGNLFTAAVAAGGASVLPLDSEHAALWQCLGARAREDIARVIITASGGPFRTWPAERMARAAPADALKHPVWNMGRKISVDSATLANKALEVMEAGHLFGLGPDALEVLVHPQSVVHGMVEFVDGSVIAHMGVSDMRQPIQHMLFHPGCRAGTLPRLDVAAAGRLEFEKPDMERFPLLALGLDAMRRGGSCPAEYDAANETAVELFLAGRMPFGGMAAAVGEAMRNAGDIALDSLEDVFRAHARARETVGNFVAAL